MPPCRNIRGGLRGFSPIDALWAEGAGERDAALAKGPGSKEPDQTVFRGDPSATQIPEDATKIRNEVLTSTTVAIVMAGALAATGLAAADATPAPRPGEPTLAEVRRATEQFRDVNAALAAGYIRDPFNLCDSASMMGKPAELGAMGIHYFRPDLLGITAPPSPRVNGAGTHTDFRTPAILIYE